MAGSSLVSGVEAKRKRMVSRLASSDWTVEVEEDGVVATGVDVADSVVAAAHGLAAGDEAQGLTGGSDMVAKRCQNRPDDYSTALESGCIKLQTRRIR